MIQQKKHYLMFAFKILSINDSGKTWCPQYFLDAYAAWPWCLNSGNCLWQWTQRWNWSVKIRILIACRLLINHELCCQFPNCRTIQRLCLFEWWMTLRLLQGWVYGAKKRCRYCPHWAHILRALWQIFLLLLFSGPVSKIEYIGKLPLLWRCHFLVTFFEFVEDAVLG